MTVVSGEGKPQPTRRRRGRGWFRRSTIIALQFPQDCITLDDLATRQCAASRLFERGGDKVDGELARHLDGK
jgi:hypothetical protein